MLLKRYLLEEAVRHAIERGLLRRGQIISATPEVGNHGRVKVPEEINGGVPEGDLKAILNGLAPRLTGDLNQAALRALRHNLGEDLKDEQIFLEDYSEEFLQGIVGPSVAIAIAIATNPITPQRAPRGGGAGASAARASVSSRGGAGGHDGRSSSGAVAGGASSPAGSLGIGQQQMGFSRGSRDGGVHLYTEDRPPRFVRAMSPLVSRARARSADSPSSPEYNSSAASGVPRETGWWGLAEACGFGSRPRRDQSPIPPIAKGRSEAEKLRGELCAVLDDAENITRQLFAISKDVVPERATPITRGGAVYDDFTLDDNTRKETTVISPSGLRLLPGYVNVGSPSPVRGGYADSATATPAEALGVAELQSAFGLVMSRATGLSELIASVRSSLARHNIVYLDVTEILAQVRTQSEDILCTFESAEEGVLVAVQPLELQKLSAGYAALRVSLDQASATLDEARRRESSVRTAVSEVADLTSTDTGPISGLSVAAGAPASGAVTSSPEAGVREPFDAARDAEAQPAAEDLRMLIAELAAQVAALSASSAGVNARFEAMQTRVAEYSEAVIAAREAEIAARQRESLAIIAQRQAVMREFFAQQQAEAESRGAAASAARAAEMEGHYARLAAEEKRIRLEQAERAAAAEARFEEQRARFEAERETIVEDARRQREELARQLTAAQENIAASAVEAAGVRFAAEAQRRGEADAARIAELQRHVEESKAATVRQLEEVMRRQDATAARIEAGVLAEIERLNAQGAAINEAMRDLARQQQELAAQRDEFLAIQADRDRQFAYDRAQFEARQDELLRSAERERSRIGDSESVAAIQRELVGLRREFADLGETIGREAREGIEFLARREGEIQSEALGLEAFAQEVNRRLGDLEGARHTRRSEERYRGEDGAAVYEVEGDELPRRGDSYASPSQGHAFAQPSQGQSERRWGSQRPRHGAAMGGSAGMPLQPELFGAVPSGFHGPFLQPQTAPFPFQPAGAHSPWPFPTQLPPGTTYSPVLNYYGSVNNYGSNNKVLQGGHGRLKSGSGDRVAAQAASSPYFYPVRGDRAPRIVEAASASVSAREVVATPATRLLESSPVAASASTKLSTPSTIALAAPKVSTIFDDVDSREVLRGLHQILGGEEVYHSYGQQIYKFALGLGVKGEDVKNFSELVAKKIGRRFFDENFDQAKMRQLIQKDGEEKLSQQAIFERRKPAFEEALKEGVKPLISKAEGPSISPENFDKAFGKSSISMGSVVRR